jgi:hypothetical protein
MKVFGLLRIIAPEGSELDTIFGSYEDWVKAREESFAIEARKSALSGSPQSKADLRPKSLK